MRFPPRRFSPTAEEPTGVPVLSAEIRNLSAQRSARKAPAWRRRTSIVNSLCRTDAAEDVGQAAANTVPGLLPRHHRSSHFVCRRSFQ